MRNTNGGSRRQMWLTVYRFTTVSLLVAIVAMGAILIGRSFMPISVTQASKVEQASSFLESVGFNDPIYLGVKPATEGEYPTFRAAAIGGKSIDLAIRTAPNGGWEIQPDGLFKTVASADDFARVAQQAVSDWKDMPAGIKPRTDGAFGEYETRKADYDLFGKYNPDSSYWGNSQNETRGWPRK